jgi:predicted glycosyltransferase
MPSCLYYALGGGLGHAWRSLAIARQVALQCGAADGSAPSDAPNQTPAQCILINTPFANSATRLAAGVAGLALRALAPSGNTHSALEFVRRALDQVQPDVLVVDAFPRGLGGELFRLLRSWDCVCKVLVGRLLPDEYLQRFDLRRFVQQYYDYVIVPGESSPFSDHPRLLQVAPILVRSSGELLEPDAARRRLRLPPGQDCILFVGSGTFGECLDLWRVARQLATGNALPLPLRFAWPSDLDPPDNDAMLVDAVPLLECYRAVRAVVGNAGYHLAHETRAAQVPAVLIARRRLYDRQLTRATLAEPPTASAIADQLRQFLAPPEAGSIAAGPAKPPHWVSGAVAAGEFISRMLGKPVVAR